MTLAPHASAALHGHTSLRLPAHPAFMVVRRARFVDAGVAADVEAWFEHVRDDGCPVLLADAGVHGDALIAAAGLVWRVSDTSGGIAIAPCERNALA